MGLTIHLFAKMFVCYCWHTVKGANFSCVISTWYLKNVLLDVKDLKKHMHAGINIYWYSKLPFNFLYNGKRNKENYGYKGERLVNAPEIEIDIFCSKPCMFKYSVVTAFLFGLWSSSRFCYAFSENLILQCVKKMGVLYEFRSVQQSMLPKTGNTLNEHFFNEC